MGSTNDRLHHRVGRVAALFLLGSVALGACSDSGDDAPKDKVTTTADQSTTTTTTTTGSTTTVASAEVAAAWDRDAQEHRGQDGETFDYECPAGGEASTIWGTETYTDDSSVCTAAVHVGLITLAEGGSVTIEIAPGEDLYPDGVANDITSTRYGSWDGSFTFPDAPPGSGTFTAGIGSWSVNVAQQSLELGARGTIDCAPDGAPGSLWGTDVYTSDSSICTAAAHAGLITVQDGGLVEFKVVDGQATYEGSESNGITSSSYGAYDQSFSFIDEQPAN